LAALVTSVVPLTGLRIDTLPVAAASGGDDCATGQGVLLLVSNQDASPHDVTLVTPQTVDGDLEVADRTITVPAGATVVIPVTDRYRNPSTGRCSITYPGGVTGLSVGVIRV